ncbi:MFS transporter [soil metagenome]
MAVDIAAPGTSTRTPVPRPWLTFAVLAATAALTILDVSKVGVALPAIQASTGGEGSTVQFMLVGYTLAYAVFLLPAGRVGDVLPRKAVFLTGAFAFLVASVICALAPDIGWLVAGRLVQGAGAGILMPQVLGLIQRIFPAGERAKPLAMLAVVTASTSVFGPVLAGVVMQLVNTPEAWRALFWINVAVGVVVLPLAWRFIREPESERRHGFDWVGVALLAPAVVLTIAPLSTISTDTPATLATLGITLLGLLFGFAFVRYEIRRSRSGLQALVDPLLFGFRHLTSGVVISGFMYAAGTAGTLVITIGLQQSAGQTALQTALWMLPAAGAMVLGSWITGRLPQTRSYRLIAVGTGLGAVTLLSVAVAFGSAPSAILPGIVCGLLVINSFGSALSGPPNQARALVEVPDYRSSIAGSLIQFSQRVGSAIGMALALILYYGFEFAPVPLTGAPTLGPTLAIALTALFLAAATTIALLDREGSGRAMRLGRVRPVPTSTPGPVRSSES